MVEFEITGLNSVTVLLDNGDLRTEEISLGPGFWCRVCDKFNLRPEEFDADVVFLYYFNRPHELIGQPVKMADLGFFQCPKCELVYSKACFDHQDPCDNCRWKEG